MKLKILTYLFDNALIVMSTIAGIITAIFSLWVVFSGDNEKIGVLEAIVQTSFIWLMVAAPIFFIVGGVGAPIYMIITHYKIELQKAKENPEHLEEERKVQRLARNEIIKKLIKPASLYIYIYIPSLAFIRAANPEKDIDFYFFLASAAIAIPAYLIAIIFYFIIKLFEKKNLIRSPNLVLVIEIALYISCGLFLISMNPGKAINIRLLLDSAILWAVVQPAVILFYCIFRWFTRSNLEKKSP